MIGTTAPDSRPVRNRPVHPVVAIALFLPQAVAIALVVAVLGAWAAGAETFWPLPELTLSEAVVTRDYAEVVRLIDSGADPNQPAHIRADMLNSAEYTRTPLEAAVGTGVIELVQLLIRHGAVVPPGGSERDALICESVRVEAEDITELLIATGDGSDPRDRCAAIPE